MTDGWGEDKECVACGDTIPFKSRIGRKQWAKTRWCSRYCRRPAVSVEMKLIRRLAGNRWPKRGEARA
jgi:hypothetical protein